MTEPKASMETRKTPLKGPPPIDPKWTATKVSDEWVKPEMVADEDRPEPILTVITEVRTQQEPLKFADLTDEQYREYVFPDMVVRIDNPIGLHVTKKSGGDSHRIVDAKGISHYIPAGWRHLRWCVKPGKPPYAF